MDWTRDNEVSVDQWELFVWHQMICSLIHDEVAVQDETLVMSKKLPRWFGKPETFPILREVFEFGGLTVLRRPLEAYFEEDLRDRARVAR